MEKLGGRKFIYALVVVVLASLMVVTGNLTGKEWIGLVEIIGGIYVLGNVGSKLVSK